MPPWALVGRDGRWHCFYSSACRHSRPKAAPNPNPSLHKLYNPNEAQASVVSFSTAMSACERAGSEVEMLQLHGCLHSFARLSRQLSWHRRVGAGVEPAELLPGGRSGLHEHSDYSLWQGQSMAFRPGASEVNRIWPSSYLPSCMQCMLSAFSPFRMRI